MFAALSVMLNETVEHWNPPTRDVFGAETHAGGTFHRARILRAPGVRAGPASGQAIPDAAACIWLIDHPRPISVGSLFLLPGDDQPLKAIRFETRTMGQGTLHKVWIS